MDLDGVAEELYAAVPEEFVALRTARAGAARAAKDRPLATAIAALRRPTRSAWLVNQLAREGADELGDLLDLGEALAQAQRDAAGPELRRLSAQRHAAVDALVRSTVEIGVGQGHQASDATRQEVAQILTAALADPSLAATVRAGRVTQAVAYGGFGPDLVLGPGAEPALPPPTSLDAQRAKKAARGTKAGGKSAKTTEELADERRQLAQAAAETALQALDSAREAQAAADRADADARDALAAADQAVADARRELVDRERTRDRAQRAAKDADRRAEQRRTAAAEAEQAAARAATELRRLDP